MDKLDLAFQVEKDAKNTCCYQEEAGDGPPIIGVLYVQQWALHKLTGGGLIGVSRHLDTCPQI